MIFSRTRLWPVLGLFGLVTVQAQETPAPAPSDTNWTSYNENVNGQRFVNLGAFFLQISDFGVGAFQHIVELLFAALALVTVQIQITLDLGQWRANRLGPQNQGQSGPIPAGVDAGTVDAPWRQQALVFVKTQRAQGDAKLPAQLGDAKEFGRVHIPVGIDKGLGVADFH